MSCRSILLPTAIVDLVNADDVSYGEVIILFMIDAVPSGGSQGCTTVTLGFTHFEGTCIITVVTPHSVICTQTISHYTSLTLVIIIEICTLAVKYPSCMIKQQFNMSGGLSLH